MRYTRAMEDHRDARFVEADFSGAHFRGVNFSNVKITDAWLAHVEISGQIANLSVNGVDVTQYVERELNARHPERALLTAGDPDGVRVAWQAIETFAGATIDRAGRLRQDQLNESVDGEWSFLETMRHLVFATDRWISGPVLRHPEPFHPLGMPNPPLDEVPPGMFELDSSPTFDEVVEIRRERMGWVAGFVSAVGANDLNRLVPSPNGGTTTIRTCLHVVFREEWWHDQYARRDLAVIEAR